MTREIIKTRNKGRIICFIDVEKPIPGLDAGSVRVSEGAPSARIPNRRFWTFAVTAYDAAMEKAFSLVDEAGLRRDTTVKVRQPKMS